MVTRPGNLMRTAQIALGQVRKQLKGFYMQSVTAMSLKISKIHDDSGEVIMGQIRWGLHISSTKYRRRRAYTLVVPVMKGEPDNKLAYLISSGGKRVVLSSDAILEHMRLSDRETRMDKGRPLAELSHRPE